MITSVPVVCKATTWASPEPAGLTHGPFLAHSMFGQLLSDCILADLRVSAALLLRLVILALLSLLVCCALSTALPCRVSMVRGILPSLVTFGSFEEVDCLSL